MKKRELGSALAIVLIMGLVLFTLLKALILISHGSAYRTKSYTERVSAGYVLEAGVADAMSCVAQDPDWVAGFADQPMRHGPGFYTVTFAPTGVVPSTTESVNNLTGGAPVDGPRGPASVPPGTAEVIVLARVGSVQRTAHVFLTGGAATGYSSNMLATGRIFLKGKVDISGITDLESGSSIDAGIHSNRPGVTANVVRWSPIDASDQAVVHGKVSATSGDSTAVNMPGATITGGTSFNVPSKPIPSVDIVGQVTANGSAPPPTIGASGGTLGSGTYHSGSLTINGDLNLDGAKLYVDGNLRVNGKVSGSGSLYVTGQTELKGDTHLTSAEGVALFSRGSVKLTGFDGTAYLDALAASDPQAATHYGNTKVALKNLHDLFDTSPPADYFDTGPMHSVLDDNTQLLGGWDTASPGGDNLGSLILRVQAQPPSPSRDFVIGKLSEMKRWTADSTGDSIQDYLDGTNALSGLMVDASHDSIPMMVQVATAMRQWSVTRLGSSYFQGTIYTNGYLYASNDVTVIGAIFANDDGSQSPELVDGEALQAGDIFLNRGVSLTINQKAIDDLGGGPPPPTGGGQVTLKSWVEQ